MTTPEASKRTPEEQAVWDQATADEAQNMLEASVKILQQRVVALNVEVRLRDARIGDLERLLAVRRADETPADTGRG